MAVRKTEKGKMMDIEERDDRVMALATEALSRLSGDRDRFLQLACQNDPGLYHDVSEVVSWEERMCGFLCQPLIDFVDIENLDRPFKPSQLVADRYEIIREVGEGGMGVVYEANDLKLEHRIAIKCPKLGYDRLPPELRSALKVRHRNICLVNDIHKVKVDLGELEFLTMEFLDGETLLSRLGRGRLESAEALQIARQLCAGLSEAHHRGVLHRDLKPANVILSEENKQLRVVITDFGLAADQAANTDLLGGTASYMAPEMKEQRQTSTASDVYALGVILYEMVTGQRPFQEPAKNNGYAPVAVAPTKLVRHLPRIWNDAILPCLAPHPADRPSVEEALAVLNRKPLYRRPWVAIAALALFTIGTALWPKIVALFQPPDVRLAILPVQAPQDLAQLSNGILSDVTERVKRLRKKAATISVIPPSEVAGDLVSTPEQAGRVLHATHALQLKLSREGSDIVVEQLLIELAHQTRVGDFSNRYSPQTVVDIPSALTGAISSTLHFPRPERSDEIASSALVAYERGLFYLSRDSYSYDEAINSFQEAATEDPHSPLPLAGLVEAQLAKYEASSDQKWMEQARESLQRAEALNRDSVRVLLAGGRLSLKEGRYPAALDYYGRIQETEPRNISALHGMAFTLGAENKVESAIQNFRQAIQLDPQLYSSYETFGSFYFNHGRYQEAEEQFRKGIHLAPGRPAAYANLGGVLLDERKYVEAVEALQTSLKLKENPQALNNLGAAYAFLKRDDLAVQNYWRAATLQPGYVLYWVNLADSERRLGNLADAKLACQEGKRLALARLALNPQHGQMRAFLAYCRARLGDKAGARNDAGWALTSRPGNSQVIRYVVLTYVALGDTDNALKALEQGTKKLAEELDSHPDLAEFRENLRFRQWVDKKR
jgi:serine/threonine protein kinase/tetratricopeptide (TPR) repeat protein